MKRNEEQRQAESAWKTFHKRKEIDFAKPIKLRRAFPKSWGLVGRCVTTYYSSDKWQKDRTFFERYYHDHNKKTQIWLPTDKDFPWLSPEQPPTRWLKPPKAVAALGFALGFDAIRFDNGKEIKLIPDRGALLVCDPAKRRLYVLEDSKITALIWGPALRVEARGIVG